MLAARAHDGAVMNSARSDLSSGTMNVVLPRSAAETLVAEIGLCRRRGLRSASATRRESHEPPRSCLSDRHELRIVEAERDDLSGRVSVRRSARHTRRFRSSSRLATASAASRMNSGGGAGNDQLWRFDRAAKAWSAATARAVIPAVEADVGDASRRTRPWPVRSNSCHVARPSRPARGRQ